MNSLQILNETELKRKRESLLYYLNNIDKELEKRYGIKSNTTIKSLKSEKTSKKKVTKAKTKKAKKITIKKSNTTKKKGGKAKKNDNKSKITIKIMKTILLKNKIKYKTSLNKDELFEIVKKHNLVRLCLTQVEDK